MILKENKQTNTYLFGEKTKALVLPDTFVALSEERVEWLTSCSVVSGRVAGDGESGDDNLPESHNSRHKQRGVVGENRSVLKDGVPALCPTMRSKGSSVSAALSSSSLYSSSSHMRCKVLRGSLSSTGMDTLDRSLPMLFLKMFQRLMLLVSGHGAGRQLRRPLRKALPAKSPLATGSGGGDEEGGDEKERLASN